MDAVIGGVGIARGRVVRGEKVGLALIVRMGRCERFERLGFGFPVAGSGFSASILSRFRKVVGIGVHVVAVPWLA
jgi:hypothetical protein